MATIMVVALLIPCPFSWDDDAYTRYLSLMSVLMTETMVPDGRHVKWGKDCKQACNELTV